MTALEFGYRMDAGGSVSACDVLRDSTATVVLAGVELPAARYAGQARSYARGYAELGYRPGSLAMVTVRRPADRLGVVFGAWWAGLRIVSVSESDHRRRDRIALEVEASLQVCDAEDIIDEEHILHRDVPALAPEELFGPPVAWPARCRSGDAAVTTWNGDGPGESLTQAELVAMAQDAGDRPGGVFEIEPDATGGRFLLTAVRALLTGGRLVIAAGAADADPYDDSAHFPATAAGRSLR